MKGFLLGWYRLLLSFFQKLFFHPIAPTSQPISLIVWRDAHLGDGLLTLPSLIRIRQNFPTAKIILLSHNNGIPGIHFKDYLEDGVVDEIWDRSNWNFAQLLQKIKESKSKHLLALLPYSASLKWNLISIFLVKLARVKHAGGWKKETTFFAKKHLRNTIFPSEMQRLESLLTDLKFSKAAIDLPLPWKIEEVNSSIEPGNYVVFAPFTKGVANRWPDEYWIQLGQQIQGQYSNLLIIVVGGFQDRKKGEEWIKSWGKGTFVHLPIPQLIPLVRDSKWVVGADSGVIHIANLLKKDNITLFGNSDYRGKWAHPENERQIVLYPDRDCLKCLGKRDSPCHCMHHLSVDAVLKAMASYS